MKTLEHYRAVLKLATSNNIHAAKLRLAGWQFAVAKGGRGYCRYSIKTITIPRFALDRGSDYTQYYLAHEMAHAMLEMPRRTGAIKPHSPEFMEVFKSICPLHLQHYECGYKPRNAAAAGISAVQQFELEPLELLELLEDTRDYSEDLFDL